MHKYNAHTPAKHMHTQNNSLTYMEHVHTPPFVVFHVYEFHFHIHGLDHQKILSVVT